jgi:hypothetical protein
MRVYLSVGIGDMVCVDSLLTEEERQSITEIFWACRFGKDLITLFENNDFYPNIRNHHVISDEAGKAAMSSLDSNAVNFWHFRPDFPHNYNTGRSLFNINESVEAIDAARMFSSSSRIYNNSSFLETATLEDIPWGIYNIEPKSYILVHFPTSTRPRGDIATLTESDWNNIISISRERNLKLVIITDTIVEKPISDCIILYRPPIKTVVSLIKYSAFYAGCDSFCAILAVKALNKENILIKSHKANIQEDILVNTWTQKYFLPLTPQEITTIYKNYI